MSAEYPNPIHSDWTLEQRAEFANDFEAKKVSLEYGIDLVEIREQVYDMALLIQQASMRELLTVDFEVLDTLATHLYNLREANRDD